MTGNGVLPIMNNLISIFRSGFESPVITFLLTVILLLHIPLARKQSTRQAALCSFLAAGSGLLFAAELVFLAYSEVITDSGVALLLLVKILLILISSAFLVILHLRFRDKLNLLEDKFRKVFNTSPYAMTIVRISDGMLLEVNSAFLRVSGYSTEELIGKTTIGLGMWQHPRQRAQLVSKLLDYQPVGPAEYVLIPRSGKPTVFLVTAQLIFIKGEMFMVAHLEVKHDKSASGNEAIHLLRQKLSEIMSSESLYKTPGLTLSDLAEKLETNKTYLSQAINSEYGNFNEYVNKFRVIEACRMIQNGLDPRFSIDHLYQEVGFSSRSAFYDAFKKFTGVSPARFRQINFTEMLAKSNSNSQ